MRLTVLALIAGLLPGAAPARDLGFVTSQNGNAVSVIDLETAGIMATVPLPGAPAPVAYDAAADRAYVIAADTGRLWVLDSAGQILKQRDLGQGAFGLATGPQGAVYVADWFRGRLSRFGPDLQPVWQSETGAAPAGVAVDQAGDLIAVAERDDNSIAIFRADDGQLLHRVATAGEHPFAVTFHAGVLYSADVQSDLLSVIDPVAGRLIAQIATGSHPYGIAFAGGRGFVTNQYAGSVTVFDPATRTVLTERPVGDYPEGIAPLPDGSGVIVANWDSDTAVILDAGSLSIRAQIDLPPGPRAFGMFTGRQAGP